MKRDIEQAEPVNVQDGKTSRKVRKLLTTNPKLARTFKYRKDMGACFKKQDVDGAVQIFREIKKDGIDLGAEFFQCLLALLVKHDRSEDVHDVFSFMKEVGTKLNEAGYLSMIRILSQEGKCEEGEVLLKEMVEKGIPPKLRSYTPLLVAYCERGKVADALRIYNEVLKHQLEPTDVEFTSLLRACNQASDEDAFYRVLRDMRHMLPTLSSDSLEEIVRWFKSKLEDKEEPKPSLQMRVSVDVSKEGKCSGCGKHLASMDLSEGELLDFLAKIEESVKELPSRAEHWEDFKLWLGRNLQKYDVVVDGANVGYFEMNYSDAPKHINYDQIDSMIDHLVGKGLKPLVFIHARHLDVTRVPFGYREMVAQWKEHKHLYVVPYRHNDDWFWLYATLYKGGGTVVITNDEMRDHHFEMLSLKSFLKWKHRHQAHFRFTSGKHGIRDITIQDPPLFSRCIQERALSPSSTSWHFPTEEDESRWICIEHDRAPPPPPPLSFSTSLPATPAAQKKL